jgi:Fe2+ or Zn2+ uptake regulation protein
LTADQILVRVRQQLPSISLATIYNTLHELAEIGLVQELDLGLGLEERRYDVAVEEHDHVVCMSCGWIEDVARRDGLKPGLDEDSDFEIVDRQVTYLGFCGNCASSSEAK